MQIDQVSTSIVSIALYLDSKVPGIVSEIWIDKDQVDRLKSHIPNDDVIKDVMAETYRQIGDIKDSRRQNYLRSILSSLEFQINNLSQEKTSYSIFSKQAFGYQIDRVQEDEIRNIEKELSNLEKKTGLTRQQTFQKYSLSISEYQPAFEKFVAQAKGILPSFISNFPDEGFLFEVVTNKPWSAFNSHIAPFKSKLTLNSDVSFTKLDLYRLAFHEAYGGHHSELSHKDLLLTKQEKGEHGLVITFSPQTFISEAIAEGVYVLLGGLDKNDNDQMIGWYYDRLIFALQNAATFWFFDDGISRSEIKEKLSAYAVSDKTIENMLDFSTDTLFGKYAPVYYSAFNFLEELYNKSEDKQNLIKTLFTKPCTPTLLLEEFGAKD